MVVGIGWDVASAGRECGLRQSNSGTSKEQY